MVGLIILVLLWGILRVGDDVVMDVYRLRLNVYRLPPSSCHVVSLSGRNEGGGGSGIWKQMCKF